MAKTTNYQLYVDTYNTFLNNQKNYDKTCKELEVSKSTLCARLWKYRKANDINPTQETKNLNKPYEIVKKELQEITVPNLKHDPDEPIDQLINRLTDNFKRTKLHEDEKRWRPVQVNTDKPIGIAWLGDPHIDDPYCDWVTLRRDLRIIKNTKGLYGASLGDQTNNWVGRLARLYENHTVTKKDSWRLVEWLIREMEPLILIAGNHDMWSGNSDPVQWMKRPHQIYEKWQSRLQLEFPNKKKVKIIASHDFPGHSMWNNLHGQMKAAKFLSSAHLYIAGHKHNWALQQIELPENDICCWLARARGYKFYDEHALRFGFEEQRYGHAICTIINPQATNKTDLMICFSNLEEGAEYLKWKRHKVK
jgi:hypothetical protein